MRKLSRPLIACLILSLALPAQAIESNASEEPQAKIFPLVPMLASSIFSAVLDYAKKKFSSSSNPSSLTPQPSFTGSLATALMGSVNKVVVGDPSSPLSFSEDGTPNYQGVLITVMVYDRSGKFISERPVNADFYTGEKIKIKVQPTFTGLIEIDNINPYGERRRIYPESSYSIQVQASVEATIPPREDQFFEFANTKGVEQLIVNIHDPRASGDAMAKSEIYRQDLASGSYYIQSVAASTYPAISQPIQFSHK